MLMLISTPIKAAPRLETTMERNSKGSGVKVKSEGFGVNSNLGVSLHLLTVWL